MSKSKWEIKELSPNITFSDSSKIVLSNRLTNLLNSIELFFKRRYSRKSSRCPDSLKKA